MKTRLCRRMFGVVFSVLITLVVAISIPDPGHAAGKPTPATVLISGINVAMYDKPGKERKKVKEIPAAEFPQTVIHYETTVEVGRMHRIALSPRDEPLWVKGSLIMLPEIEGVVAIKCDADQTSAAGKTGRGVGGRTACVPK